MPVDGFNFPVINGIKCKSRSTFLWRGFVFYCSIFEMLKSIDVPVEGCGMPFFDWIKVWSRTNFLWMCLVFERQVGWLLRGTPVIWKKRMSPIRLPVDELSSADERFFVLTWYCIYRSAGMREINWLNETLVLDHDILLWYSLVLPVLQYKSCTIQITEN